MKKFKDKTVNELLAKTKHLVVEKKFKYIVGRDLMVVISKEYRDALEEAFAPFQIDFSELNRQLSKNNSFRSTTTYEKINPVYEGKLASILEKIDKESSITNFIRSFILWKGVPFSYFTKEIDFQHFSNNDPLSNLNETTSVLEKCPYEFCEDLTKLASAGRFDPVIGREKELEELFSILLRKKKSNAILLGEAGVGKTALVEELANRINQKNVPDKLKEITILNLNVAEMLAGSGGRGEFEERITTLVKQLSKDNIILFIDEIHTIVGTGSDGNLDLSNILKPALARGEIRCIGATTFAEYKAVIENEKALSRRFQVLSIRESSIEETKTILAKLRKLYSDFHQVNYTDASLAACVDLAAQYLPSKYFPDKAIELMDESGAKALISKEKIVTDKLVKSLLLDKLHLPKNNNSFSDIIHVENELERSLLGQTEVVQQIIQVLKRSRVSEKSRIVMNFFGGAKYWKTRAIETIRSSLGYRAENTIHLYMSEYQEPHSVSKLIGAPPGYKSSEAGGMLTEKLKNNPYSIVVLHDFTLAHDIVKNFFYQIMENESTYDNKGNLLNLKHVLYILDSENLPQTDSQNYGSHPSNEIVFKEISPVIIQRFIREYVRDFSNKKLANIPIELNVGVMDLLKTEASSASSGFTTEALINGIEKTLFLPILESIDSAKCEKIKKIVVNITKKNEITLRVKQEESIEKTNSQR